jgi:hypothetical protein
MAALPPTAEMALNETPLKLRSPLKLIINDYKIM